MFGIGLKSISTILTLILIGPPLLGAGYTLLTAQPQPVFMPKDLAFKATYGATWGFWTFWQWVRPYAGLTGGAQTAVAKLKDSTIGIPTTTEELNESATWTGILQSIVTMADSNNASNYYLQYANSFGVDVNQTWQLTLYIVSNDGSIWLSRLDATWQNPTMTLSASNPMANAPTEVLPHYGLVITLDSVQILEFVVTGGSIDWAKLSMNTLQTFYKGNIQAWTIKS
jgi:hypothetical protein